jgi:serine/threonine protein phosphatase PrpC
MVAIQEQTLWCANVGDSRAILGKMQSSNKWSAVALSRDHKPNLTEEAKRIATRGGRVDSYHEEDGEAVGPSRVWLKDQSIPGLAISRSLGDSVAASVGVIPDPETIEMKLGTDDKFVLLGSDGLFEYLSNRDLVRMVVPYWKKRDAAGAAEEVIKEARRLWETVRAT